MNPQNPKTFPQKTTDKPDEYRNEKWEETKSRLFKSNMGRFATTIGVGGDYPMADAKLITEAVSYTHRRCRRIERCRSRWSPYH